MSVFNNIAGLHPNRTAFDMSADHRTTGEMGKLIPIYCKYAHAGDTWKIGNELVIRMQPLAAPIMHEISATTHTFFVPFRLLWDKWERFFTGGKRGDDASIIPRWNPRPEDNKLGSLWDYMRFPLAATWWNNLPPDESKNLPHDFPRRAYNFIWDEYYRDQDLQKPLNPDTDDDEECSQPPQTWGDNRETLFRSWAKDYFTSARPFRQRGTAPAFPVSGETEAVFLDTIKNLNGDSLLPLIALDSFSSTTTTPYLQNFYLTDAPTPSSLKNTITLNRGSSAPSTSTTERVGVYANNKVSFDNATTFDVADLRLAVQIQKWMERNARAGVRYTESIGAHFGRKPRDERLNRPEYIGGTKQWITVSEVLQTSESSTESPQGEMTGHALSASGQYVDTYHVDEPGLIMTLLSVMPKAGYEDGIDREFLFDNRYEIYWPEYAHLSEQAIYNMEVYPVGGNPLDNEGNPVVGGDLDIWGYIPRYDEYRISHDRVSGEFRQKVPTLSPSLAYWHLIRSFNQRPNLSRDFIECKPDKRIFLVPGTEESPIHGLMINFSANVTAIRPMPPIAEPGLVDHF